MVSRKIDGIRCLIKDGVPLTRTLKPIPNRFVRSVLSSLPSGLDGELVVGEPNTPGLMNRTASAIMAHEGEPDFEYHVFDLHNQLPGFVHRHDTLMSMVEDLGHPFLRFVKHDLVCSAEELDAYEEKAVAEGYEGVMLRGIQGRYKFGRSTEREGILIKMKRFEDDEAIITGSFERKMHVGESKTNVLGLTERDHRAENFVPAGDLGGLVCAYDGVEFEIGSGFDAMTRRVLWNRRERLVGKMVKFKFQGLTPDKKPRFPIFLGFRDSLDMGDPA